MGKMNKRLRPLSRHENALIVSLLERYESMESELHALNAAYARSAYAAVSLGGSLACGGETLPIQERILTQKESDPRLRMLRDFTSEIKRALCVLCPEEREVVTLMYLHGLSAREIASRLCMVPRTVWRYRNRAFARLGADLLPVIARYDWR